MRIAPTKAGWTFRSGVCALAFLASGAAVSGMSEPEHSAALDAAIIRQARLHGVPEKLVRRIVMRESKYNAKAHHRAFWGLMQISYPTAKSMGFRGKPSELLDPFVNLTYAVPYLANAFIIAGKEEDAAVRLYASGYYQTAKTKGLLSELRTADSVPVRPEPPNLIVATATPIANLAAAVVNAPNARQIVEASAAAQAEAGPPPRQQPVQPQGSSGTASQPEPADQKETNGRGGGSDHEPSVMMSRGKGGLTPPKKWTKDGGVSAVARGEQRAETIAAYQHGNRPPDVAQAGPAPVRKTALAKPSKLLIYALLDPPGSIQERPRQPAFALFSGFQASAPPEASLPQAAAPPAGATPEPLPAAGVLAATPLQAVAPRPAPAKAAPVQRPARLAAKSPDKPAAKPAAKPGTKPAGKPETTIVAKAPGTALTASQKAATRAAVAKQKPGSGPVQLHHAAAGSAAPEKTADAAASSRAYEAAIRSTFK